MHERASPVDGVEDPAHTRARVRLPVFLAEDGVVGIALLDVFADELLSLFIRDRDGTPVALGVGVDESAEITKGELARSNCELGREVQKVADFL